jgi:hypothetical protein
MSQSIDRAPYSPEEIELGKRIMCAHITITMNNSYEYCWEKYIEPAERIETYYLEAARTILRDYAEDHEKGKEKP